MKTSINKAPKEKGAMQTLYFNPEQTRELLAVSDFALTLMQHYVAIAHQTNPIMEDAHLATLLSQSEQKVKRTRLALTEAGWFKRVKVTIQGEPHIIYQVGKEAVSQHNMAILSPKDKKKEAKRAHWLKDKGYGSMDEFKSKASHKLIQELNEYLK